jgi:hypothetical protein
MEMVMPITTLVAAELLALEEALAANERDARTLVAGLTEAQGGWRPAPGAWSVAECLDHLATANRVYLEAMTPPAARALAEGRRRRRPALPGVIGRWFIGSLEPPAKPHSRRKAPRYELAQRVPLRGRDFFLLEISFQHHEHMAGWIILRIRVAHEIDIAALGDSAIAINVIVIRHVWPGGLGLATAELAFLLRKLL